MLEPGDLDRFITLETAERSQADDGDEILTWPPDGGTTAQFWAQWLPGSSREAYLARQRLQTYVEGVFRMYDRDPRPTPDATRIRFDGRIFDLLPYIEIGRGEGLEIPVVAKGSA